MEKQYKSSIIKDHKITLKFFLDGVPLTLSQTSPGFYVSAIHVF